MSLRIVTKIWKYTGPLQVPSDYASIDTYWCAAKHPKCVFSDGPSHLRGHRFAALRADWNGKRVPSTHQQSSCFVLCAAPHLTHFRLHILHFPATRPSRYVAVHHETLDLQLAETMRSRHSHQAEWLLESQKHVQLLPGPEPSGTEAHDHWPLNSLTKRADGSDRIGVHQMGEGVSGFRDC